MNVDNLGGEEVFNELEECERGNLIGLVDDLYCVIVVYSLYGKLVLVRLDFKFLFEKVEDVCVEFDMKFCGWIRFYDFGLL